MRDEEITAVTLSWEAAARNAGQNLPHDAVVRALHSLPDTGVWAISQDGSDLFALLGDEVMFTIGFRDGMVRIRSRFLESERIVVSLEWGEAKPTETGGAVLATRWAFLYRDEREARENWQHITGSVVLDRLQGEQPDAREKLARAIAATAGWTSDAEPG